MEAQMSLVAVKKSDGDDPRSALREAIAEAKQAQAELDRHHEALDRARALVRQGAARIDAAVAAVAEAQETDAAALVGAIVSGTPSSAVGVAARKARIAEGNCRDEVAAAEAACSQLRVEASNVRAQFERAERAVQSAIASIVEPEARKLFEQARFHRIEYLKKIYAIDAIRVHVPDDIIKQVEVLGCYNAPGNLDISVSVRKSWEAALEALKSNADSALPAEA
jgi:hypothetical protein